MWRLHFCNTTMSLWGFDSQTNKIPGYVCSPQTQDAILVYRVLTNKACTKDLYRSLVATHTSTNFLGKTANKWNTSPSASYPPALCEFLSLLVLHAGASCGRGTKNQKGNEGSSLVTQTASGKESSGKISGEGSSQVSTGWL